MEQVKEAAGAVSEFFSGNPFTSPVGHKIVVTEEATEGGLASEDWALNMEICDIINMTQDGPRDASRAIRKRLQMQMGKNNTSVMYTLTVLETAVKNCDRRFHQLVASKDFVNELVRLIGPKFDPPQVVQEKVLSLIQSWADAFRRQPDLQGITEVYEELKAKGVEFPMTDLDSMAPIHTPKKTIFNQTQPRPQQQQQQQQSQSSQQQQLFSQQQQLFPVPTATPPSSSTYPHDHQHQQQQISPGGVEDGSQQQASAAGGVGGVAPNVYSQEPTPEQLAKLRSELDIVNGNLQVLREMLTELVPGKEDPSDLQLLEDLYKTCREMQKRITTLLQTVANEEVTSQLLLINDELNNVFDKYDRYMKNRNQDSTIGASAAAAATAAGSGGGDAQLIDFGGADTTTTASSNLPAQMANMNVSSSNQSTGDAAGAAKQGGSTYADNSVHLDQIDVALGAIAAQKGQHEPIVDKEGELKEMEAWLGDKNGSGGGGGETTKEFDDFLAGRAEKQEKNGDGL